jgi:two-component system secretion response regulator SsrB
MFGAALCESPYRDQGPNGRPGRLTTREMEIVKLVADGKTYREIASILGLSVKTVDCYSQRIKLKTQCYSVALLVRLAIKNGWIEL